MSGGCGKAVAFAAFAGLLAATLSTPTLAEEARMPRPRPADADMAAWAKDMQARFEAASEAMPPVAATEQVISDDAGPPIERPEVIQTARVPRSRPARPSVVTASVEPAMPPPLQRVIEPEDTACLARLEALGVAFEKREPIEPDGLCSVHHPLNVTSLGSGVAVTPEATLNCRTTEALALWVRDVLVPEARVHLSAAPRAVVQDSTYVCRTRNNVAGAKLSEHAHANAVDIRSIRFAERASFDVGDWPLNMPDGKFQAAIREGSCDYFTTVLGPRSNASHATHFHFDMAERRGGYRLCDLAPAAVAADEH